MNPVSLVLLSIVVQAPPAALVEDVRKLAAAETNEARFETLTAMLRASSLTFTVEPFSIDKPREREPRTEGRNIVVSIGTGGEPIVLGAHYDAARLPDGTLSRGAVDNAASSVMLVRLAEALRAAPPTRRIRIVWFDMEELGLIGSGRYVQAHASDRIAAMLNFDVNGYGDTLLFGPSERKENVGLRRALMQTCAAQDLNCIPFPQMPPGDDRSFVRANIPTLSLALLPALEAHQVWLLMNGGPASGLAQGHVPAVLRTLHTAEDTDAKIDGESMARMLRFALALVNSVSRP
jgi:Zn-dependent M28 family amino/carboxypeptidase